MHAFAVAQKLVLEARSDARAQQRRLERLGQIVDRAGLDAAHDAVDVVQRRDHDHRDFGGGGLRLQPAQDLVAADVRHHQVEQDQVEGSRSRACAKRRVAAVGLGTAWPARVNWRPSRSRFDALSSTTRMRP